MIELNPVERAKFRLLADGLSITDRAQAYIDEHNGGRPMTPADYASTSGVILRLDGDVWVNAPVTNHNPNFVTDPDLVLDLGDDALVLRGPEVECAVGFWLPPAYHGTNNPEGEPYNSFAFTHADRVRISPIEGCSMACKFCDLPYEFRYRTKQEQGLVESVRRAVVDEIQPAAHVLISGGTPKDADLGYVKSVYEAVLAAVDVPVDIMMVPIDTLIEPTWLDELGVNELSVNIEIFNQEIARHIMWHKHKQGLDHYLNYLEKAADVLGSHRVRSMLMVGLEPMEDTLGGVEALAQRGVVPVLSPFRPDPSTPLRDESPPTAAYTEELYLRAMEIATRHDVPLGPSCAPCSHNTLTLAVSGAGTASRNYGEPHLI